MNPERRKAEVRHGLKRLTPFDVPEPPIPQRLGIWVNRKIVWRIRIGATDSDSRQTSERSGRSDRRHSNNLRRPCRRRRAAINNLTTHELEIELNAVRGKSCSHAPSLEVSANGRPRISLPREVIVECHRQFSIRKLDGKRRVLPLHSREIVGEADVILRDEPVAQCDYVWISHFGKSAALGGR